jgi:hypothetical protein
LLLLIAGAVPPSRSLAKDNVQQEKASLQPAIPPRMLVDQVGFLRSLVTFGCLGLPLIWLEMSSGSKRPRLTVSLGEVAPGLLRHPRTREPDERWVYSLYLQAVRTRSITAGLKDFKDVTAVGILEGE